MLEDVTKIMLEYVFHKMMLYSSVNEISDDYETNFNIKSTKNNNIVQISAKFPNNHGSIKSDISHDLNIMFMAKNDTITDIVVEVKNIKYDHNDSVIIYDYVFNFMKEFIIAIDNTFMDYENIDTYNISEDMNVMFKFGPSLKSKININSLFSSDVPATANFKYNGNFFDELGKYSKEIAEIAEAIFTMDDMITPSNVDEKFKIDVEKFKNDFGMRVNKIPQTNHELLTNTTISSIIRTGEAYVSDLLNVYEGTKLELLDTEFYFYF